MLHDGQGRRIPLVLMVYAWRLASQPEPPSAAYICDAVKIGLDAMAKGQINGVMTYCLPKTLEPEGKDEAASGRWYVQANRRAGRAHARSFGQISQRLVRKRNQQPSGNEAGRATLSFRTWVRFGSTSRAASGEHFYRLALPWHRQTKAGSYAQVSQEIKVLPKGPYRLSFMVRDSFGGATWGYHVAQVLVDDRLVWQADVAGRNNRWRQVTVDLGDALAGKSKATLGLRLAERHGASNFGIDLDWDDLRGVGIKLADADFEGASQAWRYRQRGQKIFSGGVVTNTGLVEEVRIDGKVAWKRRLANSDDGWRRIEVDLGKALRNARQDGQAPVIALRVRDPAEGEAGTMQVRWDQVELESSEFTLVNGDFETTDGWVFSSSGSRWFVNYAGPDRGIRAFDEVKRLYHAAGE